MADRHLRGWRRRREDVPRGWGRLPEPSTLPVPARSAGPAPTGSVPPPGVARRALGTTPFEASPRGTPARGSDDPGPGAAPSAPPAGPVAPPTDPPLPKVVPLGDDLALVAMGRWDEETATIRLPVVPPEAATDA